MNIKETAQWLKEHDGYIILTHKSPDGDTIGSAAALCQTLRDMGKTAYMLPNPETTVRLEEFERDYIAPENFKGETVVSVDTASVTMLQLNAGDYKDRVDLAIDHHGSHRSFEKELCLDGSAAACGEVMYRIFREMEVPVAKRTGSCLYMAITTDTGCFRYSNTTPETLRICADLIELGIPSTYINKTFFRTKSLARVKVESRLMSEMELYDNGVIAMVFVTKELMEDCSATENDLEDIAALAGEVEGVRASITVKEKAENVYKISLRTWADLDASAVCAEFGGGGHKAAAGCTIEAPLPQVKAKLLAAIEKVRLRDGGKLEEVRI